MRNIYDQYSGDENRLTHALLSTLKNDPKLCRLFLTKFVGTQNSVKGIKLIEQKYPDQVETEERLLGKKGIPDGWIYKDDEWVLLIESKVASNPTLNQLRRHRRIAERYAFKDIKLLLLTVKHPTFTIEPWVIVRTWEDLYEWLQATCKIPSWGEMLIEYFEVTEGKMISNGYLKEGSLTKFSGIKFNDENPYVHTEAKRLLGLLMRELSKNTTLTKELGVIPKNDKNKKPIGGKGGSGAWDIFTLKRYKNEAFVKSPHYTLVIGQERVTAEINMPNQMTPKLGKILRTKGEIEFIRQLSFVTNKLEKAIGKKGGIPFMQVHQRRYKSQKATPVVDGVMESDLRTMFKTKNSNIKPQPEWLESFLSLAENKKSNLNFAIGVKFPYKSCSATASKELLDLISTTWRCCIPIMDYLTNESPA